MGLVTVAAWLAIDLVRFAGPLYSQLFDIGVTIAAGAGVATFAGGSALAWVASRVARQVGFGRVLVWLVAAIVVLRVLLMFLSGDPLVIYGLIALALGLALLLVAVSGVAEVGGGAGAVAAASFGAAVATIEQALLHTWDALWRDDVLAWFATGLVCSALVATAWRARRDAVAKPVRGLWALGLWFSLVAFAFANLAFVSSQTGYHLGIGAVLAVVGLAAGMYSASRRPNLPPAAVAVVGAVATLAMWTVVAFSGPVLVVMLPVAVASVTYLTSRVVRTAPDGAPTGARALGATAAFGLLALLPFMLIQLDYDMPIGIPHLLVAVIAAAGLAGGAAVRSRAQAAANVLAPAVTGYRRRAGVASIVAVLVGALVVLTFNTGGSGPGEPARDLRVVQWNLHYGVTPGLTGGPAVDLDLLVDDLRALDPDVLLLQEVERGWILAGGTDLLQYLADALDMNYVYAGAHDRQFGNAVLSRYPITEPEIVVLPYGTGPQGRNAVIGTIETAGGPVLFGSVHLQHKDYDATRVAEVQELLDHISADVPIVIGGDYNDTPDSRAVALMEGAGFVSIQDLLLGEQDTYIGSDFIARIDYSWLGADLTVSDFAIGDSPRSDHMSLTFVVTVN